MQNRCIKLIFVVGACLFMFPVMEAFADAPIVQGHSTQPAANNSTAAAIPATPLNASATTQTPDQALVTSVDSDTSVNPGNNSLDVSNQIVMLQQQVQDLRGQLEVQGHVIAQLQAQVSQLSGGQMTQAVTTMPAAAPQSAATPQVTVAPSPVSSTTPQQGSLPATTTAVVHSSSANTSAGTASTQPTTSTDTAATNSTASQTELQLYQQAYNLMAAKQYSQATVALQTYLQQYPNGQYAANSHYWLGELALISGNMAQAQSQFTIVVNQFNQSPKAADAMLKLGMVYYEQQQWQQAKAQFNAVIKQYPNTTTAQLAAQQLRQIQQSGN